MDFITRIKDAMDSWTGDYLGLYVPDITLIDVIEVIILAFFFYRFIESKNNAKLWFFFRCRETIVKYRWF